MDTPAIVLCVALGLVAGWFVVVPIAERIPEPLPLEIRAKVAVALVNGALWGFVADKFTRWLTVLCYVVVFSAFVAVSVVDLRLHRLPDRIVFPSLGVSVALFAITSYVLAPSTSVAIDAMKDGVVGLVAYFGILFVFHVAYPRGMGFGDVKLALVMGFTLGWTAILGGGASFQSAYLVMVALFLGCIFGILFGLGGRVLKGRGGEFPFGPALALSCVYVVLTFENYIVR